MARSLTRSFIRHVWAKGLDPSINSLWRFFMKHSGNCQSTISPSSSSQNKSSWLRSSVDILEAFIHSKIEFEAPKKLTTSILNGFYSRKFEETRKEKYNVFSRRPKLCNCACLCLCFHRNGNTAGPVCRFLFEILDVVTRRSNQWISLLYFNTRDHPQ